jgi:hypothetical protein
MTSPNLKSGTFLLFGILFFVAVSGDVVPQQIHLSLAGKLFDSKQSP